MSLDFGPDFSDSPESNILDLTLREGLGLETLDSGFTIIVEPLVLRCAEKFKIKKI